MENIKTANDSTVTICINGDESRYLTFDTEDLKLYTKLKNLYMSLGDKQADLVTKIEQIKKIEGEDKYGAPLAGLAIIDAQTEYVEAVTNGLDSVFGEGTCHRLFGDVFNPGAYGDLLQGILERIHKGRDKKLDAMLKKPPKGRRVMR